MIKKMLILYSLLIIALVLAISICYTYIFKSNFDNHLIQSNNSSIDYLTKYIEQNIIRTIEHTYAKITIPSNSNTDMINFLNNVIPENDPIWLRKIHVHLKDIITSNPAIIDSIDVYNKESNIMASTSGGIRYFNIDDNYPDWLLHIKNNSDKTIMLDEGENIYSTFPTYRFISFYPLNTNYESSKTCISININKKFLLDIIQNSNFNEMTSTFIIDSDSNIVLKSSSKFDEFLQTDGYHSLYNKIKNNVSNAPFNYKISGENYVVSTASIRKANWTIVILADKSVFYKASNDVIFILFVISLFALLLGVWISIKMSNKLYNPIKNIVKNIKQLSSDDETSTNEYEVISRGIEHLSKDVSNLKNTINENIPLIKRDFINSLISGTITDENHYIEILDVINVRFDLPYFNVLKVNIPNSIIDNLNIKDSNFIRFEIVKLLEQAANDHIKIIATEINPYTITSIINALDNNEDRILIALNNLNTYIYQNLSFTINAELANWTKNPLDIYDFYKTLEDISKYRYFYPKQLLLCAKNFNIEANCEPDNSYIEHFQKALQQNDLNEVINVINGFILPVDNVKYSFNCLNSCMFNLLNKINSYMQQLNICSSDIVDTDLYDCFYSISNIYEFKEWVVQIVEKIFDIISGSKENYSLQNIEKIKKYIEENLDKDISLTALSDMVYLTPPYLSKVFKSKTGQNVTEYIFNQKMEKAKNLLLQTSLPIADIGKNVGFLTPHYFIKKFKDHFGVTPKIYRNTHIK